MTVNFWEAHHTTLETKGPRTKIKQVKHTAATLCDNLYTKIQDNIMTSNLDTT